jgi:MipA family protein
MQSFWNSNKSLVSQFDGELMTMRLQRLRFILLGTALAISPAPLLAAEDGDGWVVRLGGGPALEPAYPGADSVDLAFFPIFRARRAGEEPRFEAPDDAFDYGLVDLGGFSFGPAVRFDWGRDEDEALPGLREVDLAVELGVFADLMLGESFRLRAEVRQAVSGHDGLVADFGADFIVRPSDRVVLSVGPRMRWADDDYMSSYFSVSPAESVLSGLSEFEADSGIVSFGALGSVDFPLGGPWGVIAYARYDRLVGDAGDAPLVRSGEGSRDQFGAGVGVSYEFGL